MRETQLAIEIGYQFFGSALELGKIGWDPLESTCRHASLSIL